MTKDYSFDAMNRFLDYTIEKGLLKPETAKSRKTAVNKILEKINDEQRADLRKIDLESETEHFANRHGTEYIPSSLQVYKSRSKAALTDFVRYVDDPMQFRPTVGNNGRNRSAAMNPIAGKPLRRNRDNHGSSGDATANAGPYDENISAVAQSTAALTFPIPIRAGLVVQLSNVPFDLAAGEADKIAQVVKALASKE